MLGIQVQGLFEGLLRSAAVARDQFDAALEIEQVRGLDVLPFPRLSNGGQRLIGPADLGEILGHCAQERQRFGGREGDVAFGDYGDGCGGSLNSADDASALGDRSRGGALLLFEVIDQDGYCDESG